MLCFFNCDDIEWRNTATILRPLTATRLVSPPPSIQGLAVWSHLRHPAQHADALDLSTTHELPPRMGDWGHMLRCLSPLVGHTCMPLVQATDVFRWRHGRYDNSKLVTGIPK